MNYSIKDLEEFSGIKAHTIRIWEQRYGLLKPQRTETNIRYYTDEDLKKILNCKLLKDNGVKISKIASLSEQEIENQSKQILLENATNNTVESLALAVAMFDQDLIRAKLRKVYEEQGMIHTYEQIISPLLNRIGQLWQVNTISVAHEHFVSNIIREFIIAAAERIEIQPGRGKAFLFLHEKEQHEIPLLISYYTLKKLGFECYYFGYSLPEEDLTIALQQIQPEIIISSFISKIEEKEVSKLISILEKNSSVRQIYLSGFQALKYEQIESDRITLLKSAGSLEINFV